MVEITLFEFNLESVDFTANAPFSAAESPEDLADESGGSGFPFGLGRQSRSATDEDEDVEVDVVEEESGGRSPVPVALGLGLVVVLFLVGRRLMSGESEPLPE